MAVAEEAISFFATAGRGTESFAASEIMEKLDPIQTSVRDGKVLFKLSPDCGLNIHKILALRSVERLFVAVTDYDNTTYIQTKMTFLDKLMNTLSAKGSFSTAKMVLAQLISLNKNDSKTEDGNNFHCLHHSTVHVPKADVAPHVHHNTASPLSEPNNLQSPLRNSVGIRTTKVCVSRQDAETSFVMSKEPAEKSRKLDAPYNSISETVEEFVPDHEGQTVLFCSPGCERQTVPDKSTDHNCVLSCSTTVSSEQPQVCQPNCSTESNIGRSDEEWLSFRMSVKCSGKVSKWINLKKLSRDLGWRVARATGWRVHLRQPQFEVCVHISDDHVTAGVPLTRFPLSRRVYLVDYGLRAPVAWIMSRLGSIKPGDIVLDPMCGKATILIEACSDVKDAWFMGSDSDTSQLDKALQNLNTCGHCETSSLLKADGLNMPYRDSCLDVVICDAPFNQKHLIALTPQTFYYNFLSEIHRALRPQGRCVILISEQLKHMVLSVVQGTEESQQHKQNTVLEASTSKQECKDNELRHDEHHKTTDVIVPLTYISSHYVKLGETHACIIVLHKIKLM